MSNYKDLKKRKATVKKYRLQNREKLLKQRKKWDSKYLEKPETKEKMSIARIGNINCLGYKHTEEAKQHMREGQQRRNANKVKKDAEI